MDLIQTAIRNTGKHGVVNLGRYVASIGLLVAFARLVGPEVFGIVTLATVVLTALTLLARWGTAEALMQEPPLEAFFSTVFWVRMGTGVLTVVAVAALAAGAAVFEDPAVAGALLVLGLGKAVVIASDPFRGTIQREFRLALLAVLALAAILIGGGVGLWLVRAGREVEGLVVYYAIQDVLPALAFVAFAHERPALRFNPAAARWFLSFARTRIASEVLKAAEANGDDVLVGTLGSAAALGLYTVAWRLATAFHTVFQPPLTQGILPTFSRVKDSNRHSREGIKFVLRLQSHFAVPGYVFVAATAPTLIALAFGADWAGAAPALRALTPMGVCYPLAATMRQFYYARGEQWRVFAIQRYYVPATLLGVVIGVPTAGVVGACAVISAGQVLAVLLFAREIHRDVGLELRQSLLPAVAAGVASAAVPAVLLWTDAVSLLSPLARLLAVGATVVVGFYSTLLILDRKRISEEFDIVRRALRD